MCVALAAAPFALTAAGVASLARAAAAAAAAATAAAAVITLAPALAVAPALAAAPDLGSAVLAAAAAAALGARNRLLCDHLLQWAVARRSGLEPRLLRRHHAERRCAIYLELADRSGARLDVRAEYD